MSSKIKIAMSLVCMVIITITYDYRWFEVFQYAHLVSR